MFVKSVSGSALELTSIKAIRYGTNEVITKHAIHKITDIRVIQLDRSDRCEQ